MRKSTMLASDVRTSPRRLENVVDRERKTETEKEIVLQASNVMYY